LPASSSSGTLEFVAGINLPAVSQIVLAVVAVIALVHFW
jgi:hypothetical protein